MAAVLWGLEATFSVIYWNNPSCVFYFFILNQACLFRVFCH